MTGLTATTLWCLYTLFARSAVSNSLIPRHQSVELRGPLTVEANGVANIYITYKVPLNGELSIHYGSCDSSPLVPKTAHHHQIGSTVVGEHPLAKRHAQWNDNRPERFVWLVPGSTTGDGCIFAYSDEVLVGRSEKLNIVSKRARRAIGLGDIGDAEGPWFDGVEYLKAKEPESVFVSSAKSKTIGILGGGMSGLMSSFILNSVGFYDWKIIEASGRIGGRVHTAYLNGTQPDEYQYQEMGPMRFPVSLTLDNETVEINDHKMVFQLAAALNDFNENSSEYMVNFIKWIQSSPNTPANTKARLPDGTVPTTAEIESDPKLATNTTYTNATAAAVAMTAYNDWLNLTDAKLAAAAKNVFTAHKAAVEAGYLDFSESGYIRYRLGTDLNITDEIDSLGDNYDSWYYDNDYFSANDWRTIDKGLTSLPKAFGPLVLNRTMFQTTVQEVSYNETTDKVTVGWRSANPFDIEPSGTMDFDYIITAVPFTRVRLWRLPAYSDLLSRAINRMNYAPSCKIAIQYKTRFWEHLDNPIFGGCGSTDIPGVGSICYPSYKLNSSEPGVLLATYESDENMARSVGALSDTDHVALIQRAMIEVHGPVAQEQFTGNYDRHCWEHDPYESGAWCSPLAGQQRLYLPAYFRTEFKTVFVGEHTSYTHAWIWSALESAVRGTTQLMLDMGLVDEAKQITETWMARWISV